GAGTPRSARQTNQEGVQRMLRSVGLLIFVSGLCLQAQPQLPAGVTPVRVAAEVNDGQNILVDLTAEGFKVADNGKRQEIVHVALAAEPDDLVIMVDHGQRMQAYAQQVAAAAKAAMAEPRKGDRVSIVAFDTINHVLFPLGEEL